MGLEVPFEEVGDEGVSGEVFDFFLAGADGDYSLTVGWNQMGLRDSLPGGRISPYWYLESHWLAV